MTENDRADDERRRVAEEIAARLRRGGIALTGEETGEELVRILEEVERFEAAVQRAGGDLMIDEPVKSAAPLEPDNSAFVLPAREPGEGVPAFIDRISEAIVRVSAMRGRR